MSTTTLVRREQEQACQAVYCPIKQTILDPPCHALSHALPWTFSMNPAHNLCCRTTHRQATSMFSRANVVCIPHFRCSGFRTTQTINADLRLITACKWGAEAGGHVRFTIIAPFPMHGYMAVAQSGATGLSSPFFPQCHPTPQPNNGICNFTP